jgi:hypothetical protein
MPTAENAARSCYAVGKVVEVYILRLICCGRASPAAVEVVGLGHTFCVRFAVISEIDNAFKS